MRSLIENLRVTVLVDNTADSAGLASEHGLALWIEADRRRILFDTGQGGVLLHNAERLGIDLRTTEMVALSHGHYDHIGGLSKVLALAPDVDVYVHPAALAEKFAHEKTPPHRAIGLPDADRPSVQSEETRWKWTPSPTELFPGVHVTGEIPRRNDFEDVGGPFYLDAACQEPDPILDDQALYVETPRGIVVVLGCAHSGVANTLERIAELSGPRAIHAVVGGMHLGGADYKRLEGTVAALCRHRVEMIAPGHCTGQRSTAYLRRHFPGQCLPFAVGRTFTFGDGPAGSEAG